MTLPLVLDEGSARLAASTSSVVNLIALLDAFASTGGKPASLLRRIGVAAEILRQLDARIPFDALLRAWELAPAMVGDDAFGLHMGEGVRRGAFALVEYVARASATLARGMTGVDLAPLEVTFEHREPASLVEHRRVLRARLWFSAPQNQIVLRRSLLELPLREADPSLAAVLDRCVAHALERLPPISGVVLCRELIASQIGAGIRPRVSYIARELALSPRSLQRVLGDSGLTFRDVVDDVRKQLALAWASNSSEQAAQIAYRLGYADASAFHHAFRRWTGHTVSELRRRGTRAGS